MKFTDLGERRASCVEEEGAGVLARRRLLPEGEGGHCEGAGAGEDGRGEGEQRHCVRTPRTQRMEAGLGGHPQGLPRGEDATHDLKQTNI